MGGNLKPELLYLPGELEGEVASNTRQPLNVETVVPCVPQALRKY